MAQGKIPFHEKNLSEVIKRSVRSGRLAYSTDVDSFARKCGVIFLAEDHSQHLVDLVIRIAKLPPNRQFSQSSPQSQSAPARSWKNGCRKPD